MLEMFRNLISPVKILVIVLVSLSFVSCKNRRSDTRVSPGEAKFKKTFFKKYCSAGSVEIFKRTTGESASVSRLDQVNPGDKVSIKGTVTGGTSLCHNGSLSFSCEAQIRVGGAFVCESGSIISGLNSSTTYRASYNRQTQYQRYGTAFTGSKTFRGGGVVVYDNGTKASVSVSFNNPSAYCPQCYCPVSFTCR